MTNVLSELRRKFGTIIPEVGQSLAPPNYLSTQILPLDWALGGGLPRGHITHVYGPEGVGKSGMLVNPMLECIAHPRINGQILYFALESKVNTNLLLNQGIPPENITIIRSTKEGESTDTSKEIHALTGDKAFDIIREAIGKFEMIVVDSVGAMSPAIAHLSEAGANQMALVARLLSNQLPICTALLGATQTVMVLINQERSNIVTGYAAKYAPDSKAFGGRALMYHPAINARMSRTGQVSDKTRGGFRAKVKTVKNSFGVEKREASWDVYYDTGVDLVQATFDFGLEIKAITCPGGRCKLGELSLNHPDEKTKVDAVNRLREEPDLYAEVYRALVSNDTIEVPASEDETGE